MWAGVAEEGSPESGALKLPQKIERPRIAADESGPRLEEENPLEPTDTGQSPPEAWTDEGFLSLFERLDNDPNRAWYGDPSLEFPGIC
jgi:hypothetical protein